MTARARRGAALAVAVALVPVSCGGREPSGAGLPPPPHVVEVAMAEYHFSYDPDIPPGRVVFRVRNTGRAVHSLSVLPLTDDVPPIDRQLRGERRLGIRPFADIGPRRPGTGTSFAADLAAGARYALVCFVQDEGGRSHALLGMATEFRTGASP